MKNRMSGFLTLNLLSPKDIFKWLFKIYNTDDKETRL